MPGIRRSALAGGLVLMSALCALPALAQTNGPRGIMSPAGLVEADTRRFQAMVGRDIPALDRALASELVYVHSSSGRQSKAEHLGDTASGKAVYLRIDVKEQAPSLYGEVGLIQGVATFTTGTAPDAPFTLRYTDMYIWRDGRWQMVAWACSRIPEKPVLPPP